MNRRAAVAAVSMAAAVLLLTLAFGLPGQSQGAGGGGGGSAGRDVRVVNTTSEAVPVQVTQLPAVQLQGVPAVQLVGQPAVQPWHQSLDLKLEPGEMTRSLYLTLPPGKRLVVEHVSAGLLVVQGQLPVLSFLGGNPSGEAGHAIHIQKIGQWGTATQDRWTASYAMKEYVDYAVVGVSRVGGTDFPMFTNVGVSGYLIDP